MSGVTLLQAGGEHADEAVGGRRWLFVDWLGFGGAELDTSDSEKVAAVELEASRWDPYRQLSRVFHLVGRRSG
jgi:hypothetical protein